MEGPTPLDRWGFEELNFGAVMELGLIDGPSSGAGGAQVEGANDVRCSPRLATKEATPIFRKAMELRARRDDVDCRGGGVTLASIAGRSRPRVPNAVSCLTRGS